MKKAVVLQSSQQIFGLGFPFIVTLSAILQLSHDLSKMLLVDLRGFRCVQGKCFWKRTTVGLQCY